MHFSMCLNTIFSMDPEIQSFIKVWFTAILSMIYCYCISVRLRGGATRLFSLLPVIYLFTTLPLHLTSIHIGAATILYLVWLGNFKLLLFSFDQGPLYATPPLSLFHFISIALLPVETKHNSSCKSNAKVYHQPVASAVKVALLAIFTRIYEYMENVHPYILFTLYCCHLYLALEVILAITAVPVRAILGLDLKPQFNEPYLATSLQDFWGRRWNLTVSSILRTAVYQPVHRISTRILGSNWARPSATMATFLVSGLMHEVIYYYLSGAYPTWEVTRFFVLHGICVALEMAVKKALGGRWRLHRLVSGPMTVAFVGVTGVWLFLPQVIRHGLDKKAISEYTILTQFLLWILCLCVISKTLLI
ncbi:long-chain-alcohol O-fatty-acyltransferase [Olea europaea subsp. europaea]|uniref:Long-chain-alcohol O-fatty-acyltransferase n=2 Tax=Olea europaea subsp. europaea TaxID=158383 RepID=A0A8S0U3C7_OLEEU|nr:long-chain-alcohol O-fatty-acyltransferase [Olea europaea subsp. europaea]